MAPLAAATEEGELRGLDRPLSTTDHLENPWGKGGHVVAEDLDQDGDIDLLFPRFDGEADLYENDGAGVFTRRPGALPELPGGTDRTSFALVADVDADGAFDILVGHGNRLTIQHRTGPFQWGAPSSVWVEPPNAPIAAVTANVGDLDDDGDLDLLWPGVGPAGAPPTGPGGAPLPAIAAPSRVLLWVEDRFEAGPTLWTEPDGSVVLTSLLFDRDDDGDLDALLAADLERPTGLFENRGLEGGVPRFVEIGAQVDADIRMGAMGQDLADLDGDGTLDLCISDNGPPRCLLGHGPDSYIETSAAVGLAVDPWLGRSGTIGWGVVLADLDRDGWPELVQGSGPFVDFGRPDEGLQWPALLWQGLPGGTFRDARGAFGLDLAGNFPGVVAADFDGDRCLELIFAGPGERPRLYRWTCDPARGAYLSEPADPGTIVEVLVGGRWQRRSAATLQGTTQGPSRLFFGLGEEEEAKEVKATNP